MKNNFVQFTIEILSFVLIIFFLLFVISIPSSIAESSPPNFENSLTILNSNINHSKVEGYDYVSCIGTLKNSSNTAWDELVFEVQFFNSKSQLIDTFTTYNYGMVAPPNDEIAFRIKDGADKKIEEYKSHKVRVTSAQPVNLYKSKKKGSNTFVKIMISWTPMLLLIAVWIFLMRKYQGKNSPQKKILEIQEKQCALVEQQNKLFEKLIDAIKDIKTVT